MPHEKQKIVIINMVIVCECDDRSRNRYHPSVLVLVLLLLLLLCQFTPPTATVETSAIQELRAAAAEVFLLFLGDLTTPGFHCHKWGAQK